MKFFSISLLLVYTLFISAVSAEQLSGLYEVAVPVESQSSADLRKATATGLATVFVRMSGRADSTRHPEIKQAVASAQAY